MQSGKFAYLDEPRDVRLETRVLQWIPAYEELGFCLQFQLFLPGKSSSSNLTVLLKIDESQEIVLWQLSGYHGDQWSLSQVSWTPRRSAKVEKYVIRHMSHRVPIIDDHRVPIIDKNAKRFLVGILLVKNGQISSCVTFLPATWGHSRHLYSRQTTPTFVIICIPWKHLFALEYFQTFKIVFRGFGTVNGSIAVAIDCVQVKAQFCPTLPKYAKPGMDAFPNRKVSTPSTQTWSHSLRLSVS